MARPDENDAERRRVFRRMAWTFVYLPPLLLLIVAAVGGMVTALMLPFPYVGYWLRALFWAVALVAGGLGAYLVQRRRE